MKSINWCPIEITYHYIRYNYKSCWNLAKLKRYPVHYVSCMYCCAPYTPLIPGPWFCKIPQCEERFSTIYAPDSDLPFITMGPWFCTITESVVGYGVILPYSLVQKPRLLPCLYNVKARGLLDEIMPEPIQSEEYLIRTCSSRTTSSDSPWISRITLDSWSPW